MPIYSIKKRHDKVVELRFKQSLANDHKLKDRPPLLIGKDKTGEGITLANKQKK